MFQSPGLIVVDGPDATGKTTLIRDIQNSTRLPTAILHLTYEKSPTRLWLQNCEVLSSARELVRHGFLVLLDRSWISENVYQSIYRPGRIELAYVVRHLDRVCLSLGAAYIIATMNSVDACVASFEKSKKERFELYEMDSRITLIAERFWSVAYQTGSSHKDYVAHVSNGVKRPDFYAYDWTNALAFQQVVAFVDERFSCRRSSALFMNKFYAGGLYPSYIFVTERERHDANLVPDSMLAQTARLDEYLVGWCYLKDVDKIHVPKRTELVCFNADVSRTVASKTGIMPVEVPRSELASWAENAHITTQRDYVSADS